RPALGSPCQGASTLSRTRRQNAAPELLRNGGLDTFTLPWRPAVRGGPGAAVAAGASTGVLRGGPADSTGSPAPHPGATPPSLPAGVLPALLGLLICDAAGEGAGYLLGAGAAAARTGEFEFHRARHRLAAAPPPPNNV